MFESLFKLVLGFLGFVAIFIVLSCFSGWILSIAWNATMGEIFPRIAELGIPLVITWWQGFKISFLLGILGGKFGKYSSTSSS
jgi:hypothetical protein